MPRRPSSISGTRIAATISAGLLLAVGLAPGAGAEGYAYDLAGELMSPFCPGRTLASCPSPQAAELVQWISLQEAGGASEDEVVEMLIEQFGEEILGAPPAEGITLWAYVLPVAGFVGGGGIAALVLRRIVRRGKDSVLSGDADGGDSSNAPAPFSDASDASDDDLARLVDAEIALRR